MFKNLFKSKKRIFQESIKKEKKRLYLFQNISHSFQSQKRSKYFQFQWNLNGNMVKILSLGGIFLSIFGIIFLFKGSYFSIKHIEIHSLDAISSVNIAYDGVEYIRKKNIFMVNSSDIEQKLINYQNNISQVKIRKVFPDTLDISLQSFPLVFSLGSGKQKYTVTQNGVIIPYVSSFKGEETLPFLQIGQLTGNDKNMSSYKKVFQTELVQKIAQLIKNFSVKFMGISLHGIYLYETEREVHFYTKEKEFFVFSLEGDIEEQIKKLSIFIKEKNRDKEKFYYVDLRIPHKIFLCPQEKSYQCKKNYETVYLKK